MNDEHTLLLGEIKGRLDAMNSKVNDIHASTCKMDDRLDVLERTGAKHGAIAGVFASVGVALIVEKFKKGMGL